jgi:hypothetical protein
VKLVSERASREAQYQSRHEGEQNKSLLAQKNSSFQNLTGNLARTLSPVSYHGACPLPCALSLPRDNKLLCCLCKFFLYHPLTPVFSPGIDEAFMPVINNLAQSARTLFLIVANT